MSYEPRGAVKAIIEAMRAQAPDLEWSTEEIANAAGIDKGAVSSTLRVAVREQALFSERRGRCAVYSLTSFEQEEQQEPVPFNAAYWADGDVVLYGLPEMEDGGVLLSAENLAKLRKMVAWMPA